MAARIRRNDLVGVARGRTSDEKALVGRNVRRAEEGLRLLTLNGRGKQGHIIQVFPAEGKVLVEGISPKTHHMRQGQQGSAGGIRTIEAPISLSKVALVDPEVKKRVQADLREDIVERGGHTRTARVHVARGGAKRGVEQGKETRVWPRV